MKTTDELVHEISESKIFLTIQRKPLREVIDRVAVSYANDIPWIPEFFEIYCTSDE